MEKMNFPKKPESKAEEEKKLLTPDMISGKLFDAFKGREDVRNWIKNKEMGLITNAFVAMTKQTLDTVKAMESEESAKEVAKYIKDDMDFNTRIFGDPEKETAFKVEADNFLNETYLKPEEPDATSLETKENR